MAARPPGMDPLPETIDDSPPIDETAPPQKSPLRGVLPFGPGDPRLPPPAAPSRPVTGSTGEETAPPQRSPLAAALPFRHAKPAAATMAIPIPTTEDLRRLAPGGQGAPGIRPALLNTYSAHSTAAPRRVQAPAAGGPLPAPVAGRSGLSIEQYAALCAEIAVFPQAAETAFASYGLASPEDRLTADLAWQESLRAAPALMQRWQSLYLHYHEHYSRHGKR